jgi:lipopolysaccharide transport system ATP-binding protein
MKQAEIRRKFDEIVAFSGVEKFIDTPIKHYSSGMYVRLAFAIAAHLEPDILIIDEVLAVGDAEFQKKCWERWTMWRRSKGELYCLSVIVCR